MDPEAPPPLNLPAGFWLPLARHLIAWPAFSSAKFVINRRPFEEYFLATRRSNDLYPILVICASTWTDDDVLLTPYVETRPFYINREHVVVDVHGKAHVGDLPLIAYRNKVFEKMIDQLRRVRRDCR